MTWMDVETVIMSEIHQTDKDISHDITYIWNFKNGTQMNLFSKQKWNHRCRKVIVTKMKNGEER